MTSGSASSATAVISAVAEHCFCRHETNHKGINRDR